MLYHFSKFILVLIVTILSSPLYSQTVVEWDSPKIVANTEFGNSFPRIVVDKNDNAFVSWGDGTKVYFTRSIGNEFDTPIQLNDENTPAFIANWTGPDIAVKDNRVYVGFMNQDWQGKSYIVSSNDAGVTFSEPTNIEDYTDFASRFPTVTIDENGHPIVGIMKMGLDASEPHYVVRKSTDFGQSFTIESNVGSWSGSSSEACDCCPASIFSENNTIAICYRDNLENIRNIWSSISYDNGENFDVGMQVDETNWQVFSCPADGPDGVIHDNNLATIYYSDRDCYLTISDLPTESISSSFLLSSDNVDGQKSSHPRIDNDGNKLVFVWRTYSPGNYLMYGVMPDINNPQQIIIDTLAAVSSSTVDIAFENNKIHVVYRDNQNHTIVYQTGTFILNSISTNEEPQFQVYPNPARDQLSITSNIEYEKISILSLNGSVIKQTQGNQTINISDLPNGNYFIQLEGENKIQVKQFTKY